MDQTGRIPDIFIADERFVLGKSDADISFPPIISRCVREVLRASVFGSSSENSASNSANSSSGFLYFLREPYVFIGYFIDELKLLGSVMLLIASVFNIFGLGFIILGDSVLSVINFLFSIMGKMSFLG